MLTDLDKVKQDGLALQYVLDQTLEICLAAVKQDKMALIYVTNATIKLSIFVVLKSLAILMYINQTNYPNHRFKKRLGRSIHNNY
jgi:ABC-type Fe3+ transport system substrate-binding protein